MHSIPSRRSSVILSLALALAACAAPTPEAAPPAPPAPAPAPPPPPPPVAGDWRDMKLTPGDWRYAPAGSDSVARFGDGLFEARCVSARRVVTLTRAGPLAAGAGVGLAITTSTATLTLPATVTAAGAVAELPASNAGLDQMAFSRGRFVVAVTGLATLYVPTWPEFARVVEDCRRPG